MSDREKFLHELARELNAMEREVDAVEAEVRAEQPEVAEELRVKLDAARAHAEQLKDAPEHEWDKRSKEAHSAWEDLKHAFTQVRSRLGD